MSAAPLTRTAVLTAGDVEKTFSALSPDLRARALERLDWRKLRSCIECRIFEESFPEAEMATFYGSGTRVLWNYDEHWIRADDFVALRALIACLDDFSAQLDQLHSRRPIGG